MDTKQMITNVRRLYEEVYSKGNLSVCDELCANNLKLNDPATTSLKPGIASFKDSENTYHKAFPHKKSKIEDISAVDDKVFVRWSCQGKHEGELQGIAPTHRTFNITGISIYRFTNGKISEIWQSWDRLTLFEQLGVLQVEHALH
jgi:steroid delta-isomerase-like uncharacterized protein